MIGIMVGVMILNAVVLFALARLFGLVGASAVETALMLAGSGEFAFVIMQTALQDNLLTLEIGDTALVASTLSMFSIPLPSGLTATIRRRVVVAT